MLRGYQGILEDMAQFPEGGGEVCAQRYQGTLEYRLLFPEGGGQVGDQRVPGDAGGHCAVS